MTDEIAGPVTAWVKAHNRAGATTQFFVTEMVTIDEWAAATDKLLQGRDAEIVRLKRGWFHSRFRTHGLAPSACDACAEEEAAFSAALAERGAEGGITEA